MKKLKVTSADSVVDQLQAALASQSATISPKNLRGREMLKKKKMTKMQQEWFQYIQQQKRQKMYSQQEQYRPVNKTKPKPKSKAQQRPFLLMPNKRPVATRFDDAFFEISHDDTPEAAPTVPETPPPKKRRRPKLNPKFAVPRPDSFVNKIDSFNGNDNFDESNSSSAFDSAGKDAFEFKEATDESVDCEIHTKISVDLDPALIASDAKQLTKAAKRMVRKARQTLYYRWKVSATEYGLIIHLERLNGAGVNGGVEKKVAGMEDGVKRRFSSGVDDDDDDMPLKEVNGDLEEEEQEEEDDENVNNVLDDDDEDDADDGRTGVLNDEAKKSKMNGFGDAMNRDGAKADNGEFDDISEIKEEAEDDDFPNISSFSTEKENKFVEKNPKETAVKLSRKKDSASASPSLDDVTAPPLDEAGLASDDEDTQDNDHDAIPETDEPSSAPDQGGSEENDAPAADGNQGSAEATAAATSEAAKGTSLRPAPPPIVLQGAHSVALAYLPPRILAYLSEDSSPPPSIPIRSRDLLYQCGWCRRSFKCRSSLLFHKSQNHHPISSNEYEQLRRNIPKESGETKDSSKASTDSKFPCSQCKEVYSVEADLRRHFYDHRMCWLCGMNFSTKFSTIKHEFKVHGLDRVLSEKTDDSASDSTFMRRRCNFCSASCKIPIGKYPKSFATHLETHRIAGDSVRDAEIESILDLYPRRQVKEKSHSCISCGDSFPTSAELQEHKKLHKTCPECLLEVPTIKDLPRHIREIHGQIGCSLNDTLLKTGCKQHLCQVCARLFATKKRLEQHHETSHPKERVEAECEQCGKKCIDMNVLRKHMAIHRETRDYVCKECGKSFKSSGNLHQHKQQHNPRKHICGCGHAFTYKHGLRKHQERCFAGLPCKQPHTKNRPQKDKFGQIIPPKLPTSNGAPNASIDNPSSDAIVKTPPSFRDNSVSNDSDSILETRSKNVSVEQPMPDSLISPSSGMNSPVPVSVPAGINPTMMAPTGVNVISSQGLSSAGMSTPGMAPSGLPPHSFFPQNPQFPFPQTLQPPPPFVPMHGVDPTFIQRHSL